MSDSRLETLAEAIRFRRTVKPAGLDPDREVPGELLDELFECANWAPSHGHTEPWRFHVFTGESRAKLAGELQRAYREATPDESFREEKFTKLGKNPLLAPVVIAICMKRQESEKIPEIEEIQAVACAMQNFHLIAAGAGLGGQWSSPQFIYSGALDGFLGLGEKDRCLGLFYLGWPSGDFPPSSRMPVGEKITRWT